MWWEVLYSLSSLSIYKSPHSVIYEFSFSLIPILSHGSSEWILIFPVFVTILDAFVSVPPWHHGCPVWNVDGWKTVQKIFQENIPLYGKLSSVLWKSQENKKLYCKIQYSCEIFLEIKWIVRVLGGLITTYIWWIIIFVL